MFKDLSIFSSGSQFVHRNGTVCAISVEGITCIRNISMRLF